MHIFYAPEIAIRRELPEEESMHCIRVLRLTEGTEIGVVDGKGCFYRAAIVLGHPKRCGVEILEVMERRNPWRGRIHIAMAPTKNMDRTEWFAEKATEIGIDVVTLLRCRFSERRELKPERLSKILVSAMKQSLKGVLPVLNGMTDFGSFVTQRFEGQKFIAHCYGDGERRLLGGLYVPGSDVLVLIGPEGDFSPDEVALALEQGFQPVSLGDSRLRTETAGVVACHTIQLLNR